MVKKKKIKRDRNAVMHTLIFKILVGFGVASARGDELAKVLVEK